MSNRLRHRASLMCKIGGCVCMLVALLVQSRPQASGQRPSYAATAEDQHRDDTIANLRERIDSNSATNAATWKAIQDIRDELKRQELDNASSKGVNTWLTGGGFLGLLTSIGLQIKQPKFRGKPTDEKEG